MGWSTTIKRIWQSRFKSPDGSTCVMCTPNPIQQAQYRNRTEVHYIRRLRAFSYTSHSAFQQLNGPASCQFGFSKHVTEDFEGGQWHTLQIMKAHTIKAPWGFLFPLNASGQIDWVKWRPTHAKSWQPISGKLQDLIPSIMRNIFVAFPLLTPSIHESQGKLVLSTTTSCLGNHHPFTNRIQTLQPQTVRLSMNDIKGNIPAKERPILLPVLARFKHNGTGVMVNFHNSWSQGFHKKVNPRAGRLFDILENLVRILKPTKPRILSWGLHQLNLKFTHCKRHCFKNGFRCGA